jgi:hypothetical protein
MAALQHLLTTAKQGCLLSVVVSTYNYEAKMRMYPDEVTKDTLKALHSTVVGQRGSRITPVLEWAYF